MYCGVTSVLAALRLPWVAGTTRLDCGRWLHWIEGHTDEVQSIPCVSTIASACNDKSTEHQALGRGLTRSQGNRGVAYEQCLLRSNQSLRLRSGSEDCSANLWDAATGRLRAT
jgi:hypothetical protein